MFCVSGVADRQEQERAERERQEGERQEQERLERERGEERERGAARVDRDGVADTMVREADRIMRETASRGRWT